jgi:hypothetical protein
MSYYPTLSYNIPQSNIADDISFTARLILKIKVTCNGLSMSLHLES